MKPPEFMVTSCKGNTKSFCIISIYIKNGIISSHGLFHLFLFWPKKSEQVLTKESEEN